MEALSKVSTAQEIVTHLKSLVSVANLRGKRFGIRIDRPLGIPHQAKKSR